MQEPPGPGPRPVPKPGPHLAGAIRLSPLPAGLPGGRRDGAARRRAAGPRVRLTAYVDGAVQGVGFRWWTRSRSLELGLVGTATNLPDGRVEVVAEGPRGGCEELLELLSEQPPRDPPPRAPRSWYRRPGLVSFVEHAWGTEQGGFTGFRER